MRTLVLVAALLAAGPQLMPFGRSPESGLAGFWRIVDVRVAPWAAAKTLTSADAPMLQYAVAFRDGEVQGPPGLACPQARYSSGFVAVDDLFDHKVPKGRGPAVSKAARFQDFGATSFVVSCNGKTRDFHLDEAGRLQFADGDLVYTISRFESSDSASLGYSGPSFDCLKARTIGEKLLCDDAELAKADRVMAAAYARLKKTESAESFATVQAAQSAWLTFVHRSCGTGAAPTGREERGELVECLRDAYTDRSERLNGLKVVAGGVTIEPRMRFHSRAHPDIEESDAYPWMAAGPGAETFNAAVARVLRLDRHRTDDKIGFPPPEPDEKLRIFARRTYSIERADAKVVSLQIQFYDYTGGAHEGLYESSFNWDVAAARAFGPADVFTAGWEKFATDACVRDLNAEREKGEAVDRTAVATAVAKPTNWLFGGKGATVHFPVYSIASFSAGPSDVEIPYDALARLLKPGAIVR